jgi:hypothetical protein
MSLKPHAAPDLVLNEARGNRLLGNRGTFLYRAS